MQSVWPQFRSAILNSTITSLAATIVTVATLAAVGAWAFVRLKFPGRDALFIAVVATLAVPGFTILIPLNSLMIAAGIIAIVPPIILVLFLNRFLVQGLMAGGSK